MSASAAKETLLGNMDRVAKQTFKYFSGPGKKNTAKVDKWKARDVLQHFIYFHDATAWGIQSAALGGPLWPVPGDSDIVNEVCRRLHEHETIDDLLTQLKQAHARLMRAAKTAPDLDKPCFRRANGETLTGAQRLELLAKHWTEHVEELEQAAAKKR
jgi:hypothetical protein